MINLVTQWKSVETIQSERNIQEALADLNNECGTNYDHSSLSKLANGQRKLQPSAANYMTKIVLKKYLIDYGLDIKKINQILDRIKLPQ